MQWQDTALYQEANAVMASGAKPIAHGWRVTIIANGVSIPALTVEDLECDSDYLLKYADIRSIAITLSAGVYQYQVVPYKNDLRLTLEQIPYGSSITPVADTSQAPVAYTYKAQLFNNTSGLVEANTPNLLNQQSGDNTQHQRVEFQLLEPTLEEVRLATVGVPAFQDATGVDVIRYILGSQSAKFNKDAASAIRGVDVAPGASTQRRAHICIPDLTKVIAVPRMVNNICGGIYPTGFSFYMQRGMWYLYSPFDIARFHKSTKTLTVLNVPANRMPHPEVTYRTTATQTIVIATGEVKHFDISEQTQLNQGNGVRFVDANKVMEGFGRASNNKYVIDASKHVTEVVFNPRPDGKNVVFESPRRITTNNFNEYAALAARAGGFLDMVWQNSVDGLLYPGMPVKVMYLQDDTPQELFGVLVGKHSVDIPTNVNPTTRRFVTHTTLKIFVNTALPGDATTDSTAAFSTPPQQTIGT